MTFIDNEDENPFKLQPTDKKKPVLALSDLPKNPFGADAAAEDQRFRANASIVGNRDSNPEEAGKALNIGKKYGVPPELVEVDSKAWEQKLRTEENVNISNSNPAVQSFLASNPFGAKMAQNELPMLDEMTKFIRDSWKAHQQYNPGNNLDKVATTEGDETIAGSIMRTLQPSLWVEASREGFSAYQYGQLLERYRTGDPLTKDKLRPQIEAYELEQQQKPKSGANYVQNLIGGLLGQTFAALPEILTYGTAGATTGIAVGALGGPGGMAGGMLVGGGAGLAAGFSITMAQTGAGHIYRSVENIEGLDESTKQMLAMGGGLAVGTLAAQGGALVQKGIGQVIAKFASDKAGQTTLRQFMIGSAKYAGEAAVINGGQVFAQLLAEQVGKQLGERDLKTIFKLDAAENMKFWGEVGQGMIDGAVLGTLLHLPAAIPGRGTRMGDVIIANRTIANANALDEKMSKAQKFDMKRLSPDIFAESLRQPGEPDPPLFIDPQVVRDNRNAFSWMEDLDKQLNESAALGTEIKVRQSDFLANLDPKVYLTLRDRVRQGAAEMTPVEAQAALLAQIKADEVQAVKAQQAAEAGVVPPGTAVPEAAAAREELVGAIWGDQATAVPTARPEPPATINIPGLPPVTIPPAIAAQGRTLVDRLLGKREIPTLEQNQARIIAENEARIRANIKAAMTPQETLMQQAQIAPVPEALSVPGGAVTEQTPGRILESPSAELARPVVDADQAVKKEVKMWPRMLRTIVEQLKDLSENSAALDIPEAVIALALQRSPGNLAELRTFINDEARLSGIKDPLAIKEIHDRADAAVAALSTRLVKNEASGIVYSLPDKDAQGVAVATAQMIDSTRHIQWIKPLLEGGETDAAGRAAYNEHLLKVQEELSQSVLDSAKAVIEKKMTRAWKDDSAAMRPEVINDIVSKPVVMADEFFRTGDATGLGEQKLTAKLTREEVDTMFTPEELKAMGVKGKFLSRNQLFNTSMFGKGESAMAADMLASVFGYKDGKTMVKELIEFRQSLKQTGETPEVRVNRLVDEEVNARMIAEHGDLDLIIAEHAQVAAHDYAQQKVYGDELKALSKLSGKELMKHEDVKKLVKDSMENMPNADAADIARYRNLEGKHGRRAQELHDAKDYEGALHAKQDQIKASLMARQAIEAGRQALKLTGAVEKIADKPRFEPMSPEYNTRSLQLIQGTGLPIKGRSAETLAKDIGALKEPNYADWVKSREAVGEAIPTPSYLGSGATVKSIAEMTVANTKELLDALRTIEQLGKTDVKTKLGNKMVEVDAALDGIQNQLKGIGDRYTETAIPKRSTIRSLFAEGLKVETVGRKTDRLQDNGLMQRLLIDPIKGAQDYAWRLTRKVNAALKTIDHGEWTLGMNRLTNLVPNTTILDKRGNPLPINRGNLLMMSLYWGTEQGRTLLANTLRTDKVTINDFILENTTRKNLNFVENIWRVFDDILVPEMDKVYRSQRGFGMELPDAITFLDGHGQTRKGGYMPFIRERFGSLPALKEAVIFDNRLYDSLPSNSQKALVKAGEYSLSLDFDQLAFRIKEHIHSVSYREAIREVSKIVENDRFTTMMREAWGNQEASLFKPWLRDIANDGGRYDNSVAHAWQYIFRSLLKNAIQTFSGYNLATASIHSPSAAVNTFGELRGASFKAVALAIGDSQLAKWTRTIFMSPENAEKYSGIAWEKSVELRSRWRSSENDVRRALGQWSQKEKLNYYAEWWGQSIISYTDYMTATVAWHGGYEKAKSAGLSEEAAIAAGDKLVRAAHGSMAIADKSQFHRERNVQQFSAFYGFFNHVYNQMHLAGFDVSDTARAAMNEKSYSQMGKMLGSAAWKGFAAATFYAIAQSYNHHLVRGQEKEDATVAEWMTNSLIGFGTGMVPGVREAAFAAGHAWSIASIPTTSLLDIPRRWKRDTQKWANGGPFPVRTTIELAGAGGVRIGARQIARWAEEVQKIMNGDTPPPSDYMEWQRLFIYGHSRPIGASRGAKSDPLGLGSGPGRQIKRSKSGNPFGG